MRKCLVSRRTPVMYGWGGGGGGGGDLCASGCYGQWTHARCVMCTHVHMASLGSVV